MTAREMIFTAMRAALKGEEPAVAERPRIAPPAVAGNVTAAFIERLRSVGAIPIVCDSPARIPAELRRICGEKGVRKLFVADLRGIMGDVAAQMEDTVVVLRLRDAAGAAGPDDLKHALAGCDAALTIALWGCADSGILAVSSESGEPRSASLLPPVHLLLLRREDILSSLDEALPRWTALLEEKRPAALTFIGGPSRTADIEKVLVTGVHGPKSLYVLIL